MKINHYDKKIELQENMHKFMMIQVVSNLFKKVLAPSFNMLKL